MIGLRILLANFLRMVSRQHLSGDVLRDKRENRRMIKQTPARGELELGVILVASYSL